MLGRLYSFSIAGNLVFSVCFTVFLLAAKQEQLQLTLWENADRRFCVSESQQLVDGPSVHLIVSSVPP